MRDYLKSKYGLFVIDLVLLLIGLICLLLIGYTESIILSKMLEAIGTSLAAAAIVSYLVRLGRQPETESGVVLVAESRRMIEDDFQQKKFRARQLDLLGVAMNSALIEFSSDAKDRMLNRVLLDRAYVRLAFVSPHAHFVRQRAVEDDVTADHLEENLRQSVLLTLGIYKRLKSLHRDAQSKQQLRREVGGSLEIRVLDMCPYMTLFRADELLLWGIYTSSGTGLNSAVLRVSKVQQELYRQLTSHFEDIWKKSLHHGLSGGWLLKYEDPGPPMLNEDLLPTLLGGDWRAFLR